MYWWYIPNLWECPTWPTERTEEQQPNHDHPHPNPRNCGEVQKRERRRIRLLGEVLKLGLTALLDINHGTTFDQHHPSGWTLKEILLVESDHILPPELRENRYSI